MTPTRAALANAVQAAADGADDQNDGLTPEDTATLNSFVVQLRAAAALLREPESSEYDCAPVADALNSWCREAHVEETPSAKWQDVRAAVYRLWDKLGSHALLREPGERRCRCLLPLPEGTFCMTCNEPVVVPQPTDEEVAAVLMEDMTYYADQNYAHHKALAEVRTVHAAEQRVRDAR